MNSASKHAVTALLVISMAGCAEKKAKTVPPAQAQAPPISAGKAGALYPPPLTESQTQPAESTPPPAPVVAQSQPTPPPPAPPPSTKKSTSRKQKPSAAKSGGAQPGSIQAASPDTATPAPGSAGTQTEQPTNVAASGEPAAASPIGELTPGGTAGQAEKGKETNDLINNTENGLNAIKRPLSTQEQDTFNQIKTFLTKAKTALSNADLDGAYILATKAKVLLDELNKS